MKKKMGVVSNPLRLEGDQGSVFRFKREFCVSNPLRLEGDAVTVLAVAAKAESF